MSEPFLDREFTDYNERRMAEMNESIREALDCFTSLLGDKPLPDGTWPHLAICSGDRRFKPGEKGHSCCCKPIWKAEHDALEAEYHRRCIEIIHLTEIAGAHLCRAEKAEREIKGALELIPESCRVIVREGGGPENDAASLAVSIAKLVKEYEERK